MKMRILREQRNPLRRFWDNQVATWQHDRYIPGTPIHRGRYWLVDIPLGIIAIWVAINMLMMVAIIAGDAAPPVQHDVMQRVLFAPIRWLTGQ